jgi:hypothetical protein
LLNGFCLKKAKIEVSLVFEVTYLNKYNIIIFAFVTPLSKKRKTRDIPNYITNK